MMTILMHRRRTGRESATASVIGLAIASALALVGGIVLLLLS